MTEWPEEVVAIVASATERHGDDIDKAADEAERKIRAFAGYADLVDQLIKSAVRELVLDRRHTCNVAMKRATGQYDTQQAVESGGATERVYRSVYDYYIGGMQLGSVRGDQLLAIAESEQAKAEGHEFNAKLCTDLKRLVADDKSVRECVSETKLRKMFQKIQRQALAA